MPNSKIWLKAVLLFAALTGTRQEAAAQRLSGEWRDGLRIHLVKLDLRHNAQAGRVSGTLSMFGMKSQVEGPASAASFEISSLNGLASAASLANVSGRLDGDALLLRIAQAGEPPMTVRLHRADQPKTQSAAQPKNQSATQAHTQSVVADTGAAQDRLASARGAVSSIASSLRSKVGGGGNLVDRSRPSNAVPDSAFAGAWEFASDDGTYGERIELSVSGGNAQGSLAAVRHGYFSGRNTSAGTLDIQGAVRDGQLELQMTDPSSGSVSQARGRRRGAYLIMHIGQRDIGYARPGMALVQSAETSAEARALASALSGRIYQVTSRTSGRDSFAGGRMRLALCANGEIAYDASDLATTSGPSFGGSADIGSSVSRRGQWSVVLYAGAPTIMARWRGTGTSYSLTAYFEVHPSADASSADVNGTRLPLAGTC
jgi:hypothetical protein